MTPRDYHLNYVFLRHIGGVQHATRACEKRRKVWGFNEPAIRKQGLRSNDIRIRQIDHDPKDALAKDAILSARGRTVCVFYTRWRSFDPRRCLNRREIPKSVRSSRLASPPSMRNDATLLRLVYARKDCRMISTMTCTFHIQFALKKF